jgi:sulfide:quinone oxidoreductase
MNARGGIVSIADMSGGPDRDAMRIVIAGGGVAGLEAALALRDLAGARVSIDLVTPQPRFVDRPSTVLEPFGDFVAQQFAVSDILAGQEIDHHRDAVTWIDRGRRHAHTRSGRSIDYDALLLCAGAGAQPAHPQAITMTGAPQDPALAGLVADLDAGTVSRIAFVVPAAGCWQLPLYEVALLTAARARERGLTVALSIFTPERLPLEAFGERVGNSTCGLLATAGINLVCGAVCHVPDSHSLVAGATGLPAPGPRRRERPLTFDRIVALPRLRGPRIRGVPAVTGGFIPVDVHGRIVGAHTEYAAGDATNCPIKHGSVAAQQADAAAAALAALAGAGVRPAPFHPVARGVLLTGAESRWVSASLVGGHSVRSEFAGDGGTVADKLDARYLSPRLDSLRAAGLLG